MPAMTAPHRTGTTAFVLLAFLVGCDASVTGDRSAVRPHEAGSDRQAALPAWCDETLRWDPTWEAFEQAVIEGFNEARARGGSCGNEGTFGPSKPLTFDAALRCAARQHSLDMAQRGYFDHISPDGEGPDARATHAGYDWFYIGENIAMGSPTPADVVAQWLASPGHCANILDPEFEEVGVGYVPSSDQPGMYPNIWTAVYGKRRQP